MFKSLPFEQCMQTVRLTPSQRRQLNRRAKGCSLSCNTEAATEGRRGGGKEERERLPPLVQVNPIEPLREKAANLCLHLKIFL